MKKNKMMRLASCLLVLVLMTSCVISGTFAKYTTGGSAGDEARVAKWGVIVNATSDNIFDAKYAKEEGTFEGAYSVDAGTDDVVAPGTTKASLTNLTLSGTPEVAVKIEYTADLQLTNWKDADGNEYCPLIFTVEGKDFKIGGTDLNGADIDTIAKLEAAVEAAVAACSKDYAPNTDLSGDVSSNDAPTITWSWPFTTGADNDVKDTHLGNVAAGKVEGTPAKVILTTTVKVTQLN